MATKKPKPKPDANKSFVSGSVQLFSEWTPERIRQAERAAEQGNLRLLVQLCDWLLTDDRVKACLDARIDALMGLEVSFEAAKGRKGTKAVKALEADEDWWDAYPEGELKQLLRWGILLGVAPARHNWTERPDHGGRVLPMPKFWHPQTLVYDWQQREWRVRDDKSVEHIVTPGDGEWILHRPYGDDRPWSNGLCRALARFVLLKYLAQGDMGRASQRGDVLAGMTAGPEVSSTDEQRLELCNDLAQLAQSVIVLPNGFKLEQYVSEGGKNQPKQIELADAAIAILIRGSNLTTEVKAGSGSKAATESQAKTGDGAKLKADSQALSTTLNIQSLGPWAEFNFGDAAAAPWPVWPVEPEEDKAQLASTVKTVGEGVAIWDKMGFEVNPQELIERFGFTFLTGNREKPEPQPEPVPGSVPPAPAPKATPKASARAERVGARAEAAPRMTASSGFVQGQLYADDLVDDGRAKGGNALKPFVDDILAIVEAAEDYEGIRAAVLERYRDQAEPAKLRSILESAMVLAELAGRFAVQEDAD